MLKTIVFQYLTYFLIIILLESQKIPNLKAELWTPPKKKHIVGKTELLSQKVSIMNIFVNVMNNYYNNNINNNMSLKMFYL